MMQNSRLQQMYNQLQDKTAKDEIVSVTVRMPKEVLNRIDTVIENTNYSKNQFIIDSVIYTLDELKKMEKDGE